jgi:hypothetical protein
MRVPVGAQGRYITNQTIVYLVAKVSACDSCFLVIPAEAASGGQRAGHRPQLPLSAGVTIREGDLVTTFANLRNEALAK